MNLLRLIYVSLIICVSSSAFLLVGHGSTSAAIYFSLQFILALYLRHRIWPDKYLFHSEKVQLSSQLRDFIIVFGSLVPNLKSKRSEQDYIYEIVHSKSKFLLIAGIALVLPVIYYFLSKIIPSLPFVGSYFIFYCIAITAMYSTHIAQLMIPLIISTITVTITLLSINKSFSVFYLVFIIGLFLSFRAFSVAKSLKDTKAKIDLTALSLPPFKQTLVFLLILFFVNLMIPDIEKEASLASRSETIQMISKNIARGLMRFTDDPQAFVVDSFDSSKSGKSGTRKGDEKDLDTTSKDGMAENKDAETISPNLSSKGDPTLFVQETDFKPLNERQLQVKSSKEVIEEIRKMGTNYKSKENGETPVVPVSHLQKLIETNHTLNAYHRKLFEENQKKKRKDQELIKKLNNNEQARKKILEGQKKDAQEAARKLEEKKQVIASVQKAILENSRTHKQLTKFEKFQMKSGTPLTPQQIKSIVKADYKAVHKILEKKKALEKSNPKKAKLAAMELDASINKKENPLDSKGTGNKEVGSKSDLADNEPGESENFDFDFQGDSSKITINAEKLEKLLSKKMNLKELGLEELKKSIDQKNEQEKSELKKRLLEKIKKRQLRKLAISRQKILKNPINSKQLRKSPPKKVVKEIRKILDHVVSLPQSKVRTMEDALEKFADSPREMNEFHREIYKEVQKQKAESQKKLAKAKTMQEKVTVKRLERIAVDQANRKLDQKKEKVSKLQVKSMNDANNYKNLSKNQKIQLNRKQPLTEQQVSIVLSDQYRSLYDRMKNENLKRDSNVERIVSTLDEKTLSKVRSLEKKIDEEVSKKTTKEFLAETQKQIKKKLNEKKEKEKNGKKELAQTLKAAQNLAKGTKDSTGRSSPKIPGTKELNQQIKDLANKSLEIKMRPDKNPNGGFSILPDLFPSGGNGFNLIGGSGQTRHPGTIGSGDGAGSGLIGTEGKSPVGNGGNLDGPQVRDGRHLGNNDSGDSTREEAPRSVPREPLVLNFVVNNTSKRRQSRGPEWENLKKDEKQKPEEEEKIKEDQALKTVAESQPKKSKEPPAIFDIDLDSELDKEESEIEESTAAANKPKSKPKQKEVERLPDPKPVEEQRQEKEKKKEEEKLSEKIEKSVNLGLRIFQALTLLGFVLFALYFIQRARQKPTDPDKAKVKLTKEQIEALIKDFQRLETLEGQPAEEILRSYYTFLRLMDLIDHPRPSYLPATDFSVESGREFRKIKPEIHGLTDEFCHIFYGARPIPPESLNSVRKDRVKILHYFVS